MRTLIAVAALLFLPEVCFGGTDCHYVEYPDHYLAVCVGDEPYTPESASSAPKGEWSPAAPFEGGAPSGAVAGITFELIAPPGSGAQPAAASPAAAGAGEAAAAGEAAEALPGVPPLRSVPVNEPRPGRMSKARVEAAMAARNRVLQGL